MFLEFRLEKKIQDAFGIAKSYQYVRCITCELENDLANHVSLCISLVSSISKQGFQ